MTFADLVDIYWQMLEGQCQGLPKVYSWRTKACDFPLSCHSSSVPVRLHVVERALILGPINPPAQTHFVVTILPTMWQNASDPPISTDEFPRMAPGRSSSPPPRLLLVCGHTFEYYIIIVVHKTQDGVMTYSFPPG